MKREIKDALVAAGVLAKFAKERISEIEKERDNWESIAKSNAESNESVCESLYNSIEELKRYKEAIKELKVCISKLPIEANYFGNVDRMKYIINKL